MGKFLGGFLAAIVMLLGCKKDDIDFSECTPHTLSQDRAVIDSFIQENELSYLAYSDAFKGYAGIALQGDGTTANPNAEIAFKSTIKLLDGTVLAADTIYRNSSGVNLRVSDLEAGSVLHYFVTNARQNGMLKVIYPSSVNILNVWGCKRHTLPTGTVIPAYSQIVFDYTLTGIKN